MEFEGVIPESWRSELAPYLEALSAHRWGGPGPDRLVMAPLEQGGFVDTVKRLMPSEDFDEWIRTLGPEPRIFAKTFLASDGLITSVLIPVPSLPVFLYCFGHQGLEAAFRARKLEAGYRWPGGDDPDRSHAHVLWQHYVVERARRELTDQVGWALGDFDGTELVSESRDVETRLTAAVAREPEGALTESDLHTWMTLLRLWANARGNADAGAVNYMLELRRFEAQPFVVATGEAFRSAEVALRDIWANPARALEAQDQVALDGVWNPMLRALEALWRELG